MEDTLRGRKKLQWLHSLQVLILVLMEDTLRAIGVASKENRNGVVLILVLMEDTLRVRAT